MHTDTPAFENDDQRRRAVAWVVALSASFPAATPHPEPAPPDGLLAGTPATQPQGSVYQILYRSTATRPFTNSELLELLEHARQYNLMHQITGIMLYSEGQFVHALEGPKEIICALYERIKQDPRHHQVETVNQGPLPRRRFSEWSMDFGFAARPDTAPAAGTLPQVLPGLSTTSSHLKLLLEAFME